MDCKLEKLVQAKVREGKNKSEKERIKRKYPQQVKIRVTTNEKQKVGDCHSKDFIGSLTITYTTQDPFEKRTLVLN